MDKSHFGRIVNFLINIALGIVLVSVGLLLADNVHPMIFMQSLAVSIGVGYTICDLIPSPMWGEKLAHQLGLRNKLLFHLFSIAVGGAVLITCISFFCQFVAFGSMTFQVWPRTLPYLLLSGYLVLVVFMPICKKAAILLTR